MRTNAAGLVVAGAQNPNWRGGLVDKVCAHCGNGYAVKQANSSSRFCSLQCVGASQRGVAKRRTNPRRIMKDCVECGDSFSVFAGHANRWKCCSKECSYKQRSKKSAGPLNPNWTGGLSRLPYPWNFREVSALVIARDGGACQCPDCAGTDPRMTTHHINYDKQDCAPNNLIALCSACNSRANFGRERWQSFYELAMAMRIVGAGMAVEDF